MKMKFKIGDLKSLLGIIGGTLAIISTLIAFLPDKQEKLLYFTKSKYSISVDGEYTFLGTLKNVGKTDILVTDIKKRDTIRFLYHDGFIISAEESDNSPQLFHSIYKDSTGFGLVLPDGIRKDEFASFYFRVFPKDSIGEDEFPDISNTRRHQLGDGGIVECRDEQNQFTKFYNQSEEWFNRKLKITFFRLAQGVTVALFLYIFLFSIITFLILLINWVLYWTWKHKHYKAFKEFVSSEEFIKRIRIPEFEMPEFDQELAKSYIKRPYRCSSHYWKNIPVKKIKFLKDGLHSERNFISSLITNILMILFWGFIVLLIIL